MQPPNEEEVQFDKSMGNMTPDQLRNVKLLRTVIKELGGRSKLVKLGGEYQFTLICKKKDFNSLKSAAFGLMSSASSFFG